MFSTTSNSTLAVLASLALLAFTACYYFPANLLRWLERKRYQYEVTFSLYMMTPTEKFIFNSILFLFLSMVTIAASLYLPEHISFIVRRAFYYVAGDADAAPAASVKSAVETVSRVVGERVASVVPEL